MEPEVKDSVYSCSFCRKVAQWEKLPDGRWRLRVPCAFCNNEYFELTPPNPEEKSHAHSE